MATEAKDDRQLIEEGLYFDIDFNGWKCYGFPRWYQNCGLRALELINKVDGEPVVVATYNPHFNEFEALIHNSLDCIFIKDYSENSGMMEALLEAGVIHSKPIAEVFNQTGRHIGYRLKIPEIWEKAKIKK